MIKHLDKKQLTVLVQLSAGLIAICNKYAGEFIYGVSNGYGERYSRTSCFVN